MSDNITLVTGCAGFIGMHATERLLARGERVVGIDNLNAYYDPALKRARLARLQPHVAVRRGAAGQDETVGLFLRAQRFVLVRAVRHRAAEFFALARAASAILAAIRQTDAGANRCCQERLARHGGKAAAAGLDGDVKRGRKRRGSGHLGGYP